MSISKGDRLPDATLLQIGKEGPEEVSLASRTNGRKVVIFAVPGAFTPTCHSSHVPSFINAAEGLKEKGVAEIICVAVNDPFVMKAWGEASGASAAGITMLSDASGEFAKSLGLEFDAPPAGLIGRSKRYAMLVEDGEIAVLNLEENPGACDVSGGQSMLEAIG